MHKLKIEGAKFIIVGGINFVLTFIIFTVMVKFLFINYLLSLAVASIVGMFFSYILNFSWVFKPEEQIQFRDRLVKFFLAGVLSLSLNMWVLSLIVENFGFDPYWIQMALIPFIIVFNFSTAKLWSLKPTNLEERKEGSL